MRYFITMAALFFMVLGVFAHGGHVIDSSQPHTVEEEPRPPNVSHTHPDFHVHALVHSHDDYLSHQHNLVHYQHQKTAQHLEQPLPLSSFPSNEDQDAHQGVALRSPTAPNPEHRPLSRHSHSRYHKHAHSPNRGFHTHTVYHKHLFGNEQHGHGWEGHSSKPFEVSLSQSPYMAFEYSNGDLYNDGGGRVHSGGSEGSSGNLLEVVGVSDAENSAGESTSRVENTEGLVDDATGDTARVSDAENLADEGTVRVSVTENSANEGGTRTGPDPGALDNDAETSPEDPEQVDAGIVEQAIPLAADFNGNGVVDIPDFLLFVDVFGSRAGEEKYEMKYDLDVNGEIGIPDFLIFVESFGRTVN